MKKQNVFVKHMDIDWEVVEDGIRRKLVAYDDQLMLVKVEFKNGSKGTIHKHFHSQITIIESGLFEIIINKEKSILKAGDAFYVPPNTEHGCSCLEDGILVDVFSPMRQDFIKEKR